MHTDITMCVRACVRARARVRVCVCVCVRDCPGGFACVCVTAWPCSARLSSSLTCRTSSPIFERLVSNIANQTILCLRWI